MTLPNFLIIGAMKAGTTALYHTLNQHPQIYMSPVKEPHFFSFVGEKEVPYPTIVTEDEAYQNLFADVSDERAIGEASPSYLVHPKAPSNIKQYIPDARLVAILRNPIDRAYSHYKHQVQIGEEENPDFLKAFQQSMAYHEKNNSVWRSYCYQSLYATHLKIYFDLFDRNQIKTYLYDEFVSNKQQVVKDIQNFIGVDPQEELKVVRTMRSGKPKSRVIYNLLQKQNPVKSMIKQILPSSFRQQLKQTINNRNIEDSPKLTLQQRQQLLSYFVDDIHELETLLGVELNSWLSVERSS